MNNTCTHNTHIGTHTYTHAHRCSRPGPAHTHWPDAEPCHNQCRGGERCCTPLPAAKAGKWEDAA
eukprot:1144524-Pelagomonas_calceolata.AAC.9